MSLLAGASEPGSGNTDRFIWAIKNGDLDTVRDSIEHKVRIVNLIWT